MPQADGKKIRQLREQRGWSQDKLVDEVAKLREKDGSIEAPIVKRTIQRLEMGCRAYPHTLYVVAKALGVHVHEITLGTADAVQVQSVAAPMAAVQRQHNIPPPKDEFIGRTGEQSELRHLIKTHRLVTIAGPPGVGKTRIAMEIARSVTPDFDLVSYVPLPLHEIALEQRIAHALHIDGQVQRDLRSLIRDTLKIGKQLLVLDNCEAVLEQCCKFVDELLSGCSDLRIVVTTRIDLGIKWEHIYRMPPLEVPNSDVGQSLTQLASIDSVKLLLARAQAHRKFCLTTANARVVSDLCAKLEGIPLAIELAAAQLDVMSIDEICERFEDRLDLWNDEHVNEEEARGKSLRQSIEISCDLIRRHPNGKKIQRIFRRLSIFRGCTKSAVLSVCAEPDDCEEDVVEILKALLRASLLQATDVAGERRFYYLDAIREFAADELRRAGETEALTEKHARWFADHAEHAAPELLKTNQSVWLQRLGADADNFYSAISFSVSHHHAELALRITGALWRAMEIKGFYRQASDRLRMVLRMPEAETFPLLRAKALSGLSTLAYRECDLDTADTASRQSLHLAKQTNDQLSIATALTDMGNVASMKGNYKEALRLYSESLDLERVRGHERGIAVALYNTGLVARHLGKLDDARERLEESLQRFVSEGNMREAAFPLNILGEVACFQRYYRKGLHFGERSYQIREDLGDRKGMAESLRTISRARVGMKEFDVAHTLLGKSGALVIQIGDQRGMAECLEYFARLKVAENNFENAVILYALADHIRSKIHSPLGPADSAERTQILKKAQRTVTSAQYREAWELGQSLEFTQALNFT